MAGDIAVLHGSTPMNPYLGFGPPPGSPRQAQTLIRVATFPPAFDPDFTFPKPSNLKTSPTVSDSGLLESCNRATGLEELSFEELKKRFAQLVLAGLCADESTNQPIVQKPGTVKRCVSDVTDRRPRKKVSFADDCGHKLVVVKMADEPSDVPPVLNSEIVKDLIRKQLPSDGSEDEIVQPTWQLDFVQPASEYMRFRERFSKQQVVLENVLVRANSFVLGIQRDISKTCRLVGTIRVKNMAFDKQVFVRFSDNNWLSYLDRPAFYTSSSPSEGFDTFSFDFEIPIDDDAHPRLAFCIGYQAGPGGSLGEFWDSNEGANYTLIGKKAAELWNPDKEEVEGTNLINDKVNTKADDTDQHEKDGPFRKFGFNRSNRRKLWTIPDCGPDAYGMVPPECWSTFSAWTTKLNDFGPYW